MMANKAVQHQRIDHNDSAAPTRSGKSESDGQAHVQRQENPKVRSMYGVSTKRGRNTTSKLRQDEHRSIYSPAGNVSVWSIERISRERDVDFIAERRWLAFADFLIYSWCFRISPDGDRTRVRVDGCNQEFDSLEAFLLHYARDPGSLGLVEAV